MDPLEKLREGVKAGMARHCAERGRTCLGRCIMNEGHSDGAFSPAEIGMRDLAYEALAGINAFCKEYEAVEACEHQNGGWRKNNWLRVNCKRDPHRLDYCNSIGMVLLPRERKPSLREAAREFLLASGRVSMNVARAGGLMAYDEARDVLAAVLQEENDA